MMFGAWGNPDHDESIRIIHAALDAGINFIDTADVYGQGESRRSSARRSPQRPPRRRDRRHQVLPQRDRRAANQQGGSRRWTHPRGGGLAAAARHRLDRPLPGAPRGLAHGRRGDAARRSATSCARARSATSARPPSRHARSSRRSGPPATGSFSDSSPSSRRTRSSSAPSRPTYCPPARATAWASCPTARSPAAGCPAARARTPGGNILAAALRAAGARTPGSRPPRAPAGCPSASISNSRRTGEAGCRRAARPARRRRRDITLIQLAIAFVLNHPAITEALVGPRTARWSSSKASSPRPT